MGAYYLDTKAANLLPPALDRQVIARIRSGSWTDSLVLGHPVTQLDDLNLQVCLPCIHHLFLVSAQRIYSLSIQDPDPSI
jgi:hypothetical protein